MQAGNVEITGLRSGFPASGIMHLFHRDLGGAGNPPLVILHGMLGSSRNWSTAGADLAARYHVIALDLRNHGRSPHASAMTYEDMAADVLGWLDRHRIASAAILGHSMGGKTAMLLACRHPDRVDRLFVVDIAPRRYTWVGHRASFAAMHELDLADLHSRAEAELRMESRVADVWMRKFLTTNLQRSPDGRWHWLINLPAIMAAVAALEGDPLAAADRYERSARFIAGAESEYVGPDDHRKIRAHFPRAEIVTLPGCGHNPHVEARAAFVRAVLAEAPS